MKEPVKSFSPFRQRLHEIIFEAETPAGKIFDIVLLGMIVVSILVVILESVPSLHFKYFDLFWTLEWFFTILFTIEYGFRIYAVVNPRGYITSFFGIIDLLAILPTYFALFIGGAQYFLVVRALRLLRVFRIFKLVHFLKEGEILLRAIKASLAKITIFLLFVVLLTTLIGSLMYLVEGGRNDGFSSIPRGIYWAIVTLTTVGYGDITPKTDVGQFLSAAVMLLGYAIIAVPTGIVTGELIRSVRKSQISTTVCQHCSREGHDPDARYCKYCGNALDAWMDSSQAQT